jgi:succinoglycan biosynthesis protein ExoA
LVRRIDNNQRGTIYQTPASLEFLSNPQRAIRVVATVSSRNRQPVIHLCGQATSRIKQGNYMVSVVIPCFNEIMHIEASVRSILDQEKPAEGFEIIVADGRSDDGTQDILRILASRYSELRVIDNPGRITPHAMNVGIRAARGKYVAILGAHCHYSSNYLRTCVELLDEHPEASCVGGPIMSAGRSLFGQAVAAAMSNPVVIGNAKHRHPNYEGYAEGACYPVFRKEIFDKIGLYDENLVRNQDDELNYRLTKSGSKVFLSPRARCTYFVRETVGSLFRQYFQYGYWRVAVLKKHRIPASFRHIIPPLFISFMFAAGIAALLLPGWWRMVAMVPYLLYGATLLVAGMRASDSEDRRIALLFPIAAATIHMGYATGFLWAIVMSPCRKMRNRLSNKGECHAS